MDRSSELRSILGKFLKWNNARLTCFTKMLICLFAVKTVNLREMASVFESEALIDSRYKRLKRFFSEFKINTTLIGHWIFLLFFSHSKKLYLTIDRTNWFLGKSKINVLVLGVAYEGVAIPVFWNFMNKAGNATAAEHQAAINRFIEAFGTECIAGILGDREFASSELIGWLNSMKIPFYIRIKEGSLLTIKGNKFCTAAKIFKHLNCKEQHFFAMDVEFGGQKVFLAGSRSEKGELMIVATNRSPKNALSIYLRRWEIENLFQSLKSRGFRFEETHITKLDRLEKLVALLAIGFCWAHKVGEWKAKIKPIIFNTYRDSQRPQATYFKYGLELIRDAIVNPAKKKIKEYRKYLTTINLEEEYLKHGFLS